MLLIGDQIYEKELEGRGNDWLVHYSQQYHNYWKYQPVRDVLRRTPTYMIFDDHELKTTGAPISHAPTTSASE